MKYIDKYKLHACAHAINVRFIKNKYNVDGKLNNSLQDHKKTFRAFSAPKYKSGNNGWKRLLLEEQKFNGVSRCCYCMRKLDDTAGKVNIEHVIPKSLSGADGINQYAYYSSKAPALKDFVEMKDSYSKRTFSSKADISKENKMHHVIALSNLTAACNGKRNTFDSTGCCCNWSRGNQKIMPIFLMEQAETDVKYDANGILTITSDDGTLTGIINDLNETTLQEIRSVWYHLSKIQKDISNAESMNIADRIVWFKSAYSTDDFTSLPEYVQRYVGNIATGDDTYWHLLLAYDWFYYYPGYASQRILLNT